MLVGSISSQKISGFPTAKVTTGASLAPAFGSDSLAIRKAPSAMRSARSILLAAGLAVATAFGATSCDPISMLTMRAIAPELTPAQQTSKNIIDTINILNPIIEDSSATLAAKDAAATPAGMLKGFSYEAYDRVEDFTVKSVDELTGDITANHTSVDAITGNARSPEDVILSKVSDGFTLTHANGGQEKYAPLDVAVQRTGGSVVRNMTKGTEQGEVLLYDLANNFITTFKNFTLKK